MIRLSSKTVLRHCSVFAFTWLTWAVCLPTTYAQRGPLPRFNTTTPYLIYYGDWDTALVNQARTNFKLIIVHPSASNITPAQVASLRSGADGVLGNSDDIKVLAYISVGEDDRPSAPAVGDGLGPRIDPRSDSNAPLAGIDPMGIASPGGSGFASYYLDDNDKNGKPDYNPTFKGFYVNPGDPTWFTVVKHQTKEADGRAGILELLTTTTGKGYGCDGLFMDALDTPAPNSYGLTFFEWTTPAYFELIKKISDENPTKLLLANRGLFFFNPSLKHYAYTLRPYIDLMMFESYYADSNGTGKRAPFFDDNKFVYAPKINAEAGRPDGFTALGLGYVSPNEMGEFVKSDFHENQEQQGWPLYRTNQALTQLPLTDSAATWNTNNPDISAPQWDSTAASEYDSDPNVPGNQPPAPRIGAQEALPGNQQVTVRWDVARDQTGPIIYNLYYTTDATMDFAKATRLANVIPTIPSNYRRGAGPGRYPYEAVIQGLKNKTPYLFAVRAQDAGGREDENVVTIGATPRENASTFRSIVIDGTFNDWDGVPVLTSDGVESSPVDFGNVQVANDTSYVYVRFTLQAPKAVFTDFNMHLFVDTDNDSDTGLVLEKMGLGSELLIELGSGFDQRRGGFNEGTVSNLGWSIAPERADAASFELRLSRGTTFTKDQKLAFSGRTIRLALQDNRGDSTAAVVVDLVR